MIHHLTGSLFHREEGLLVIDASGVGYGVEVPARAAAALGPAGSLVNFWIHTVVKEDAFELFGFPTRGERDAFVVVTSIGGVGPRIGLAMLSVFTVEQLVEVVLKADAKALSSVPGIGLKRAEKLILELKGKVKRLTGGIEPGRLEELRREETAPGVPALPRGPAREAAEALEALGTPGPAAARAVAKAMEILGEGAGADAIIKEGLRHRRSA